MLVPAIFLWSSGIHAAAAPPTPRIVTLAPNLAELVCAAGGCDRLVGVSSYSDFPAEAATKPVVADFSGPNAEALLLARPTVVLAWRDGTSPEIVARVERLGYQVYWVETRTPGEIARAIDELGTLVGRPATARLASEKLRTGFSRLIVTHRGARPLKVFYQIGAGPVFTVNHASPISTVIGLCGGTNIFASLPMAAPQVSAEGIVAANPDVVIHSDPDQEAIAAFWARLPGVGASIPLRRVFVDGDLLTRAGPRLLAGATQVCAGLDRLRPQPASAAKPAP